MGPGTKTKPPNPIDKYVGSRIRMRRKMLGMSQVNLGKALSVSFQQVQKYENGVNRVGAGRLQHLAEIFEVPVTFFFDGAPAETSDTEVHSFELLTQSQCLSLIKAFMRIKDDAMRRHIVDLVKRIAGGESKL
jgi:transcriptional regulator with XRE-family HTH domain